LFKKLQNLTKRPKPFEFYTAASLWTDEYISQKMLGFHLDESVDLASRNKVFIDRSVDWIVSRFNVGPDVAVCDFGCGPGLYTTQFARRGADVTGIDFSRRSIEHARKTAAEQGLKAEYVHLDYLEFTTDRKFDLITMIYCDFCPLSPAQRKTLLGIFHKCLKDDGAVLLDVLSVNHFDKTDESRTYEYSDGDGFWSPDPCHVFTNIFKYDQEKLVLNKHTIIEEARACDIYNWLQCYSPETLDDESKRNGFSVAERFADVAGTPYDPEADQFAVVAKKA